MHMQACVRIFYQKKKREGETVNSSFIHCRLLSLTNTFPTDLSKKRKKQWKKVTLSEQTHFPLFFPSFWSYIQT